MLEAEKDFKTKEESIKGSVNVTIKCLGRIFKSEGSTVEEAINKIKIPGGTKAMSLFTVEKNGVKREKILNGRHTHQLFGNLSQTSKMIALKWVNQLFS